jgi:hypothetical protein
MTQDQRIGLACALIGLVLLVAFAVIVSAPK